jgi:hypothetical protein
LSEQLARSLSQNLELEAKLRAAETELDKIRVEREEQEAKLLSKKRKLDIDDVKEPISECKLNFMIEKH